MKQDGVEIGQPEATAEKSGEEEEGTKPATVRPDHIRSVGSGAGFVYWIEGNVSIVQQNPSVEDRRDWLINLERSPPGAS